MPTGTCLSCGQTVTAAYTLGMRCQLCNGLSDADRAVWNSILRRSNGTATAWDIPEAWGGWLTTTRKTGPNSRANNNGRFATHRIDELGAISRMGGDP